MTAGLRWTGHALLDVGIAGACALNKRSRPEDLTLEDLDHVGDFIARHYFSGALDPYLTVVFTNNSGYCGPNKTAPEQYAEVYRAHRVAPSQHLRATSGQRCAFSSEPASVWVHRQHLPMFSADGVMNFRPHAESSLPIAGSYLVALQFTPMAGRRAEGRMLVVHADDPELTLAFARRYLEDNRRLLALALPSERVLADPRFDRERPMWDTRTKRNKMADAKGPRSLVVADLSAIAARAAPHELRPHPMALSVFLVSNSGQGPSLDIVDIPSGVVGFVRRASESSTRAAWQRLASGFRAVREATEEAGGRRRKGSSVPRGRPGWSRNPAFEGLVRIYEAGFVDAAVARRWLARFVLGRIETQAQQARLLENRARSWALADLFMQEVLGMKPARIEAIRSFADKLADHIERANDRRLYRALTLDKLHEVRRALLSAQRRSAQGQILFGLDEYATVWLHEDGDEFLVRDLVTIRVVERLAALGYFASHPEDAPEAIEEEDAGEAPEEVRE
jgi:CRISPR-associated protein Cst1